MGAFGEIEKVQRTFLAKRGRSPSVVKKMIHTLPTTFWPQLNLLTDYCVTVTNGLLCNSVKAIWKWSLRLMPPKRMPE